MNNYYVYCYIDSTEHKKYETSTFSFLQEPFYVGLGTNGRMFDHLKNAEKSKKPSFAVNKIKKMLESNNYPIILKLSEGLSKEEAAELEKLFIREIGTRQLVHTIKRGPLTNLTIGGDGIIGYDYSKMKKFNHDFNSGKIGMHKGDTLIMAKPEEVEDYLKLGWLNGFGTKVQTCGTRDKLWINNGKIRKCIIQDELEEHLNNGWIKGNKLKNTLGTTEGCIAVSKDGIIKMIDPTELKEYLNNGWIKGHGKPKNTISKSVWVNNGIRKKMVKKEELEECLKSGDWTLGQSR